MKKILLIALLFIFYSCGDSTQKKDQPQQEEEVSKQKPGDEALEKKEGKEKIKCDFGFKKFNTKKRPIEEAKGGVRGNKPTKPPKDQPPTTSTGGTIYLDFWGGVISGTSWNYAGNITLSDAGFSQPEIDYVKAVIENYYKPYNVVVTDNEAVFNATPIGKRIRVCFTESWSWYCGDTPCAGGVAFINSFSWTSGEPAFVFTSLLNYNTKYIAEAGAHEAGHGIGLYHICDWVNGVKVNEYSSGKIMGIAYHTPTGIWCNISSCLNSYGNVQIDSLILVSKLGVK